MENKRIRAKTQFLFSYLLPYRCVQAMATTSTKVVTGSGLHFRTIPLAVVIRAPSRGGRCHLGQLWLLSSRPDVMVA